MSRLVENELYTQMEEHIKKAGECARRLAIVRADARWQKVGEFLLQIEKKINQIYTQRRRSLS